MSKHKFNIWYRIHRIFYLLLRSLKFRIQALFRGYSDADLWNLDYYLAKKIIRPLKRFRKGVGGHPAHLTLKKWENILDKMIFSFELLLKDEIFGMSEKDGKKLDEGFVLFGKYFMHLWD